MFKIQVLITGAIRERSRYFTHKPWNCLQLILLSVSIVHILMYTLRFIFVYDVIGQLRATFHREHIDMWFVATWDQVSDK